jgi:hypothetical protein
LLALSVKLILCGQNEYPSANPHMLLTVSGITFTVFNASVDDPLNAYDVTGEINKGSNDVKEQSQVVIMPSPAIDRILLLPGL